MSVGTALVALLALWLALGGALSPSRTQRVHFVPAQRECATGHAGEHAFSYCIFRAQQGVNGGLVYNFHGRNGSPHAWNDADFYTGQIQAYWAEHGITPPTVVSVSFGPTWLLMPRTGNALSGALDAFVSQIMPAVEGRTGAPRYRVLLGASMGGFNTLLGALHIGGRFTRAVALCPPIYTLTPSAGFAALRALATRTGADPKLLLGLWWLSRSYVRTERDWQVLSLFDLLARADPAALPALYLSCGLHDPYGNYEGTARFVQRARARGLRVRFRPLYGGHCAVDVASVAEQLVTPSE